MLFYNENCGEKKGVRWERIRRDNGFTASWRDPEPWPSAP